MSAPAPSAPHAGSIVSAKLARHIEMISRLARFVAEARGWRRAGLAFGAGALSVAALAPFFVLPVLFLTLPMLVWMIDGSAGDTARARFATAARAGWWFGFGYFLLGLFWIGEAFLVEAETFAWLLPFAVLLLPAGLALFTGLAAGMARLAWKPGLARVFILALTLGCAEWLRGHVLTGFPWNLLGYALTWPLQLMQSASLFGVYGLTLLVVPIAALPLVSVADDAGSASPLGRWARATAFAAVPLGLLYGYGMLRLTQPAPVLDGVKVRIVQASVAQRDKWRPELQRQIFEDHLDLSRRDAHGNIDDLAGITHLIWPEAAMPFLPLEHPEALQAIGAMLPPGTQLLSGALRVEHPLSAESSAAPKAYNSLMLFGEGGELQQVYDKIHLVPFGEYLPMQGVLERIGLQQLTRRRGGFASGPVPRPLLAVPGLPPVGGLICYEAIFPGAVVQGAARPGLLINVTNDGWFGDTTGPRQHFHQARVRAVEEGLPMVRAANNGVSAVVDGQGRLLAMLNLSERGVVDSPIPGPIEPTAYAMLGDTTFVALAFIFLLAAVVL